MSGLNDATLHLAAADFLYLLDHTYPRSASLQLVGNRYDLDGLHRHLLHRGVFAREESKERRSRILSPDRLVGARLLVDGHNVLITVESALAGRPLIAATDGVIRDVAGISHRYHISSLTHEAIDSTLLLLKVYPPRETLFLLDAPIRQSGELAALLRVGLKNLGLPGDAQTVKVPEADLVVPHAVVATSDSAVLDRAKQAVDLTGAVIRSLGRALQMIDFTELGV
jgi:hypothetical protein